MRVAFRVDASIEIGTGHVMRCLTLADALAARGADCHFICREHPGNLNSSVRQKDYPLHALSVAVWQETLDAQDWKPHAEPLAHSKWLGTSQSADVAICAPILDRLQPDWLVVDHYALDERWEGAVAGGYRKLMVIDDLADRSHVCDLLLDQTFGRAPEEYQALVPAGCRLLCGSKYALLRPEFAARRQSSLQRRAQPRLRHLLVSLGGVDKDNGTGKVLEALRQSTLAGDCEITVVLGDTSPWLETVKKRAQDMPWTTRILSGVNDMAQLMADSDLAIGAAGTTSWERCCLGLPTIMLVLAANQQRVAEAIMNSGAGDLIRRTQDITEELPQLIGALRDNTARLAEMSHAAACMADGRGVDAVAQLMEA